MPLYQDARSYFDDKEMQGLKQLLNNADVSELLPLMRDLESEERVISFRLLDKDRALEVFELLEVEFQQDLISSFKKERALEVFQDLDPDDRARLLDELPARVAKWLLSSLSKDERKQTADLLGYPAETAGRIMTPEYVRIKKDLSAKEALEKVRKNGHDKETVYTLYVTDDTRKLEGVISLRDLVMAEPDEKLFNLMSGEVSYVSTDTDQEEASRLLQERNLLSVPVVDKENRLVGIITFDDAIDVLEEEATEDIFERVGLTPPGQPESGKSFQLVNGSLPQIWKVRLPFLAITLVGGLLAGGVIDAYEETLESIAVLAVFIPVIMDMGGNVGTQSATIFTRALVLGHINTKRFLTHLLREMFVGLSMGLMLGFVTAIVAGLWQPIDGLSPVIFLSITLTITIATSLGFLIPWILYRLGFDQAAGSNPIITTIKDISGLLIYFYLVSLFMGHLL